ncbi:MAG: glycoside hydrolase family 5 protein, partial [Actinomycetota bacterium]|nr:glycoside hydrolase family 5 protein [Actinomycetota bacterium]
MRLLSILLTTLGLALALPGLASAAEVGAVPDITWGASRADIDRTIALMREANVRTVRLHMSWKGLEPGAKGAWNTGWLADLDYAVAESRKAGLHVVMGLFGPVPYWASADPDKYTDGSGKHWKEYYRPTRNEDFADYARFVVDRYRDQGVHDFEVWNEPNHAVFWPSGPNAAEYTALLKAAHPAIKQADPQARVVLGGLSRNDYDFLGKL